MAAIYDTDRFIDIKLCREQMLQKLMDYDLDTRVQALQITFSRSSGMLCSVFMGEEKWSVSL